MKNINIDIQRNKDLKNHTSWKVGGSAQFYCAPRTEDQLEQALVYSGEKKLPYFILGGGTNTLISDEGVKGLVIHTYKLTGTEITSDGKKVVIKALAGTPKSDVLKHFLKYRLWPAVFLAGLPGDMAGGVVMNAGISHKVSPKEFVEIVESFDVMFLMEKGKVEKKTFQKKDIQWFYRKTQGWQPGVITSVCVSWPNQPDERVLEAVRAGNRKRKKTQPLDQPSCGSVFKNPKGHRAGQLIEATGLKALGVGGAKISEKHANFIINTGCATASDIHELMEEVKRRVFEKFQIKLISEVVYLGCW